MQSEFVRTHTEEWDTNQRNFVMAAVRSEFWIPRLRTVVKRIK